MHHFKLDGYPIHVGDLAASFPAWLTERRPSALAVVVDTNTRRDCLPIFFKKTGLPPTLPVIEISPGESQKTLPACEKIWQAMLDLRLDRKALVVLLGGGVVGDLGGFCAATFKRGVAFAQVPTTLLGMTDAAIGGKLGIDFQGVKNAVGVFQSPSAVFADPDFLKTLPARELRSGFAEVLKHARIGDLVLWRHILKMKNLGGADWQWILKKSIAVKTRVVRRDPLENGLRQILNFGHTVGHALESHFLKTADPLTHGEAVAAGMVCELQLHNPAAAAELAAVVARFFEPRRLEEAIFPDLFQWMEQDKKNAAGRIRVALPADGRLGLLVLEPEKRVLEAALRFYNSLIV